MNKEVVRAQIESILEWANQCEQRGDEGDKEAAFLLRRACRIMSKTADVKTELGPEPRPKESNTTDLREG